MLTSLSPLYPLLFVVLATRHCFKGYPTCFDHLSCGKMMTSLLGRTVARDILSSTGDHLRHVFIALPLSMVLVLSLVSSSLRSMVSMVPMMTTMHEATFFVQRDATSFRLTGRVVSFECQSLPDPHRSIVVFEQARASESVSACSKAVGTSPNEAIVGTHTFHIYLFCLFSVDSSLTSAGLPCARRCLRTRTECLRCG